jgi:hypothetical protein
MMRVLGIIVGLVAIGVAGFIAWYKVSYPTYGYRYRLTVEVLVDGQVRSGSSVIGVSIDKQPKIGSAPPQLSRAYGDAVSVDLGQGRTLFALLSSGLDGNDINFPQNVVPTVFHVSLDDIEAENSSKLQGSRNIPKEYWPTFATFSDLNDPKTAKLVGPEQFAKVFGPDVRLTNVLIEMTSDPVTRGIDKKLPWLPHPRYLSGQFACDPNEQDCLHGGHFMR